jgi:hypothetical protein
LISRKTDAYNSRFFDISKYLSPTLNDKSPITERHKAQMKTFLLLIILFILPKIGLEDGRNNLLS